jgi:hypothetical protein
MTEYEFVALYNDHADSLTGRVETYVSLSAAFLVVVYLTAERIVRPVLYMLTSLYIVFSLTWIFALISLGGRLTKIADSIAVAFPNSELLMPITISVQDNFALTVTNIALPIMMVAFTTAAVWYAIWQVRNRSKAKQDQPTSVGQPNK